MSFGLYRGNEVQIIFGVLELKDMRADSFVNVRHDEDSFGVLKGSDGSMTRFATGNTLAHVDVILKRSSNENQKLHAALTADLIAPGGAGVASFIIKDAQGATTLMSGKAWIMRVPDSTNAKDVGADVTWTFDMQITPGTHIIGGNQI